MCYPIEIQGLCRENKLTMAAPTAIPANPICTRMRKIAKDAVITETHNWIYSRAHQTQPAKVLTSEIGVSITRLSPYFFHRPLLTCVTTNSMSEAILLFYECQQQILCSWKCDLEAPGQTAINRPARLSTDLVGSIILCHLLSQQEHTLIPLQLLIHRLVESIADSNLTKNMQKQKWRTHFKLVNVSKWDYYNQSYILNRISTFPFVKNPSFSKH